MSFFRPSSPITTSQARCNGPWAYLFAGLVLAGLRWVIWWLTQGLQWQAPLIDGLQYFSVGAMSGAIALALRRCRFSPRVSGLILIALSGGLGALTLPNDVAHFSQSQNLLPERVAAFGMIGVVASGVPLSVLLGSVLGPWIWGRRLTLGISLIMSALNELILPHDYLGVHLFCALSSLVMLGAAFVSAPLPQIVADRERLLSAASVLSVGCAWLVPTPPAASSALFQATGAAFAPVFERLKPRAATKTPVAHRGNWFQKRSELGPISPTVPSPLPPHPIVVLITIDALRSDVVFSRENEAELPHLTRLVDEGIAFSEARACGTLTKVSLAGLFLGTYFSQQYWSQMEGLREGVLSLQNDETPRFVQQLSQASITTHNFRSINWLRNGLILWGFDEDQYIKFPKKKSYYTPSPPVFDKLLPRVKQLGKMKPPREAFIYSHLSDPHAPYTLGSATKEGEFGRYLAEVAYVDKQLGRLLELLGEEPLASRVLLIVAADHGEAFDEHGARTHGTTLYDEELRIPLIMWRPGLKARKVPDLVSLIDLGPTILDAFSLPTPRYMMGESLLPFLSGDSPNLSRPIFAETRLMRALISEDHVKLIYDTQTGRQELYDLRVDPRESNNLVGGSARLEELQGQMDAFFQVHALNRPGYTPPFLR